MRVEEDEKTVGFAFSEYEDEMGDELFVVFFPIVLASQRNVRMSDVTPKIYFCICYGGNGLTGQHVQVPPR